MRVVRGLVLRVCCPLVLMEFRLKPHLAVIVGLLLGWSVQSQASRHPSLMVRSSQSEAARHVVVERIAIDGDNPFQLLVRTTSGVTPQAQVVTGPERLVIDVPGAIPGRALRNQTVNQSQVQRVRVGLFSASPQVTRIVLDLNSPPDYRIQTDASGFTVTLAENAPPVNTRATTKPASDDGQTIGWVTTKDAASNIGAGRDPLVVASPSPVPADRNGVRIVVGKGQMEIHARNATLSEVLFQVEQQTGAEIAIPAGTEQQKVIGDYGPDKASEVLAQLLNGSDLNFVVVGSPNNPGTLRSVILTHKAPASAESLPRGQKAAMASTTPPDNSVLQQGSEPPPEEPLQQPQSNQPRQRHRHRHSVPPPLRP